MLQLDYPLLLLLLALPVLLRRVLPEHRETRESVRIPFFEEMAKLSGQAATRGAVVARGWVGQGVLLWLVWGLMVVALARPQWLEDPIVETQPVRDLLLAVDLSGSMETRDFVDADGEKIDRFTAVKLVVDDFLVRREGDRIGLLLFGAAPFVQVPFTVDLQVTRELLEEATIGMAGPQTMMGDAIGLGIRLFDASELEEKVLILLTDGNDTGSKVPPVKAASIASERGITLHCIGVGDPTAAGEAPLDEKTLGEIAEVTGGRYFRALDLAQLEDVWNTLDEIVAHDVETLSYRPKRPLFWIPMSLGVLVVLSYHLLMALASLRRRRALEQVHIESGGGG